jgi:hypothetical protein
MNDKKKMAAIMAAVDQYESEMETQAVALQAPEQPRPIIIASNWKYSGVSEMMRMHTTWQLRLCSHRPTQRR